MTVCYQDKMYKGKKKTETKYTKNNINVIEIIKTFEKVNFLCYNIITIWLSLTFLSNNFL